MPRSAACLLIVLAAAGCARSDMNTGQYSMTEEPYNNRTLAAGEPAPLDPTRTVSDRDCSKAMELGGGNLRCR
jgi:hypothetical protein